MHSNEKTNNTILSTKPPSKRPNTAGRARL